MKKYTALPIEKRCTRCNLTKINTEFSIFRNFTLYSHCKSCRILDSREWRRDNRERAAELRKNWRLKNPDVQRHRDYMRYYGITLDEYNFLYKQQNGKCAICKNPEISVRKQLSVDHDHNSKKVRGLLCSNCNHGIGCLKDDINILRRAILYLETV